ALVFFSLLNVVLWQFPLGNYLFYPFTILSTWFHEMGHGITAILLGGNFHKLEIYPDGSGVATHSSAGLGFLGQGLTALGGPIAPAIAGTILILSGRNSKYSKISLFVLGLMMILSSVMWIRTLFGIVSMIIIGVLIIIISLKKNPKMLQLTVLFLGLQAFISNYRSIGYFLTREIN